MRRGSRCLVLVLGMLSLAAPAGASSTFFLINTNGSGAGEGSFASFDPGLVAPDGRFGNARFGRRNFLWHTDPVPLPNHYIPVGRFPSFDPYGDVSDGLWSPGLIGDPQSNVMLFARLTRLAAWRSLTGLVLRPPPGAEDPLLNYIGDAGSALIRMDRTDRMSFGDSIERLVPLPGFRARPDFGVSLEYRLDRLSFEVEDFYGSSLSRSAALVAVSAAPVAVSAVPVPEPGTGSLLLTGLCALAARRRLR